MAAFGLVMFLSATLPLFICLAPTVDSVFFDICVQTVLRGDVLYRDIFLHGPPGMVLLQSGVRSLFGWRSETLACVDLLLFCITVGILARGFMPRTMGLVKRTWMVLLLFLCYFATSEWSHGQPDVWMMVPALGALLLHRKRLVAGLSKEGTIRRYWLLGLLEGLGWGMAFLLKPFIMIPALACWLVSARLVTAVAVEPYRGIARHVLWTVLGGGLVGGAVVLWLWRTGNWPYFLAASVSQYNQDYYTSSPNLAARFSNLFKVCWPWSLLHLAALPAAVSTLWPLMRRPKVWTAERAGFALLAACYIGWVYQANFLQRQFEYHVAPTLLLGLAVVSAAAWTRRMVALAFLLGLAYCVYFASTQKFQVQFPYALPVLFLAGVFAAGERWIWPGIVSGCLVWSFVAHPLLSVDRLSTWAACWREGSTPAVRDRLSIQDVSAADWVRLDEVKRFLRAQRVSDREVTCYALSSVPLYRDMDLRPSTRFVLLWSVLVYFPGHRPEVAAELTASPQRYVVNDLRLLGLRREEADHQLPGAPLPQPEQFPPELRGYFPWTEPIVFRAGRYLVHKVRPLKDAGNPELLRPW